MVRTVRTHFLRSGILGAILAGVILYWKKNLRYDLQHSIYGKLGQEELWNEYKISPQLRVVDKNFSILKVPELHDRNITIIVKSAPGKDTISF